MRRIAFFLLSFLCSTMMSAQVDLDSAMLVQHKIKLIEVRSYIKGETDTTRESMSYDRNGHMIVQRRKNRDHNNISRYHYRSDGRLDTYSHTYVTDYGYRKDSAVYENTNTYDTAGLQVRSDSWQRMIGVHNCNYSRYNAAGQKLCDSVTSSLPGTPGVTRYEYDKAGRLVKEKYLIGSRLVSTQSFKYDSSGRKVLAQYYNNNALLENEEHFIYTDSSVSTQPYKPVKSPVLPAKPSDVRYAWYAPDGKHVLLTETYSALGGGTKKLSESFICTAELENGLWKTSTETKTDRQGKTTITIYQYRYTFF